MVSQQLYRYYKLKRLKYDPKWEIQFTRIIKIPFTIWEDGWIPLFGLVGGKGWDFITRTGMEPAQEVLR